jgi:multidrug efflux system membrane fusion protein
MTEATNTIRIAALGLASAMLTIVSQVACGHAESAERPLTAVRIAQVQTISTGSETRYSANIVPNAQVELAFKSGGYVQSIRQVRGADGRMRNIDSGDWVTKGTVLAVVRQQDYTDRREQARAQLAQAQANAEHAKLSFERTSNLYSSKSATKPEYENAKAQNDSAIAALDNAKAALAEAQTALNDSSLRAPFDGWVVKRNVDVGALVGPTTPGFTIADTRSVRAVFGVPDNATARIKLGQKQSVTTDAVPGSFAGHISAISPSADPKSRVYSVEVTVPNPNNELKAGMIASLALGGEILPSSVLAVPLSAVIRDAQNPDGFAVLVPDDTADPTTVHARTVSLGDAYGNMIQVVGGLKNGDRVITAGSTLVKSGDKVRVIQ